LAHNMDRMLCLKQSDLGDAGGRGDEKEGRKGEDALGRDENDGADEKRSCPRITWMGHRCVEPHGFLQPGQRAETWTAPLSARVGIEIASRMWPITGVCLVTSSRH